MNSAICSVVSGKSEWLSLYSYMNMRSAMSELRVKISVVVERVKRESEFRMKISVVVAVENWCKYVR
jgi:hypothetical protein